MPHCTTSGEEAVLAGADGIRHLGMKEAAQAVLVDLGDPEELYSKFTVFAPSHGCRLDRDG